MGRVGAIAAAARRAVDMAAPYRGDGDYRISRCRDAAQFEALFAPHEPRAAHAVGLVLEHGLRNRTTRALLIHDRAGALAGGIVVHRWMLNRWMAVPILLDHDAATVAGIHLDRGPAVGFHTTVSDAQAMADAMRRPMDSMYERVAQLPYPIDWADPDPNCRLAQPDDVEALVDLFWPSHLNGLPSRRVLRRFIRNSLHNTVVYDRGDGPIGMFEIMTRTPRWVVGGGMVVHPDHRDQGLSWELLGYGIAMANEAGAGGQVFVLDSNPMSLPIDSRTGDDFLYVVLRPPRRFKGEPKLHALVERLRTQRRDQETQKSYDRDRLDRSRRTQQAWRTKPGGR